MNKIAVILRLISLLMCLFASLPCVSGRGISKPHPGDEGSPQKTAFDQMKAEYTRQLDSQQIDVIAQTLASEPSEGIIWQAVAFAIDDYFQAKAPLPAQDPQIRRIFSASIKPKDHWLLYDNIANYQDPYRLRRQLARYLTANRTGQPSWKIPQEELLLEDPAKWLEKWGGLSVATPPTGVTQAEEAPPAAEIKETPPGSEGQMVQMKDVDLPLIEDAPSAGWIWMLIGLGAIGLGCLLWQFFKR